MKITEEFVSDILKAEYPQDYMEQYIAHRSSGMAVLEERYHKAIEEIITINELQAWTEELNDSDVDGIIRDIDIYYKLEMNLEAEDEE